MFRSVKNWLTILILVLVALAMLVAYIYVVPPLTNRLDQQKLRDQQLNATLISNTVAGSGVYYLGDGKMGVRDDMGLRRTVTLLGMRFNARVVVITMNQASRFDSGGVDAFDPRDYPMIQQSLASDRPTQPPLFHLRMSRAARCSGRCSSSHRSETSTPRWRPSSASCSSPRSSCCLLYTSDAADE